MIKSADIYTLRCTGCTAYVELREAEVRDPFRRMERIQAMQRVHAACDGYKDVGRAKSAMKAGRVQLRNEVLKPHVDRALETLVRVEELQR